MKKLPIIQCVYRIINITNDKFYVGSTKDFYRRKRDHKAKLNRQQHDNIHLQRSWNKYGSKSFKFEIIEETEHFLEREQYYLDTLQPPYNIGKHASGGDNLTNHPNRKQIIKRITEGTNRRYQQMTPEEKQKYSERMKGEQNPNYGNKWSKEQRRKASQRQKKNPRLQQQLQKMIELARITVQSPEYRKKLSETRKGKGNTFYGKKHSQSTKQKISQTHKDTFNSLSPEERYLKNSQTRKVKINDTIYFGVSEAARQLNVCPATICYRIKSNNPKYKNYFYIN